MTTVLNQTQIASAAAQEKSKVLFDHAPLSASMQRSSLCSATPHDRGKASSQPSDGKHALRPCIYIAFRCSHCGSVRQAVPELPPQAVIACPECSRECAFVLLESGLTARNLPFHQVHIVERTQWDSPDDGEPNSSLKEP